jgi:hypothetical protein
VRAKKERSGIPQAERAEGEGSAGSSTVTASREARGRSLPCRSSSGEETRVAWEASKLRVAHQVQVRKLEKPANSRRAD